MFKTIVNNRLVITFFKIILVAVKILFQEICVKCKPKTDTSEVNFVGQSASFSSEAIIIIIIIFIIIIVRQ
jgi:mannose/fructose/N-acetylgalactosamine-specific phosphotransferase system component IIC